MNESRGSYSVIAGGYDNTINADANYSFIGGGYINIVSNTYSVVCGGYDNEAYKTSSFIGGGYENWSSGDYSFIGGGRDHRASGDYSYIVGGRKGMIASSDIGAAVFADGQDRNHISKGSHTCSLDFVNGVFLRLPTFSGPSTGIGNIGELKVSGTFLYVATGANRWGRVSLSSF